MYVNTFSLFGFSIDSQTITDSNINISIQFQVLTGALLCIICDVDVKKCSLIFIASGQQISGVIVEPKYSFIVQQSFIQYRISSIKSSGLTNIINDSSISFAISQCQLTGSNLLQSSNNGYIASAILVHILLNITQFDICVDSTVVAKPTLISKNTNYFKTIFCINFNYILTQCLVASPFYFITSSNLLGIESIK
ncbi:Hypothetical_protein [Hexamita inflata]|uniref:Hypothetical_protein n=1 Tax=Hexamita inflata TaxID=28002 RepID=A0ABP1HSY2_9EUKA